MSFDIIKLLVLYQKIIDLFINSSSTFLLKKCFCETGIDEYLPQFLLFFCVFKNLFNVYVFNSSRTYLGIWYVSPWLGQGII